MAKRSSGRTKQNTKETFLFLFLLVLVVLVVFVFVSVSHNDLVLVRLPSLNGVIPDLFISLYVLFRSFSCSSSPSSSFDRIYRSVSLSGCIGSRLRVVRISILFRIHTRILRIQGEDTIF